ncbi:MAG: hypothetical protein R3F34_01750 [Planctomycetota bacterium]
MLGALVLDASYGPLRPEAGYAQAQAIAACRERVPDLLVVPRGVELGPSAEFAATRGSGQGPWMQAPPPAALTPHAVELARGRAESRLSESAPVVLDGREGWDDAFVWQTFGLAPLFGPDVEGAPWRLSDRDLVRFARLLEVFDANRDLPSQPPSLVATKTGPAPSRAATAARSSSCATSASTRSLSSSWSDRSSVSTRTLEYEARRWHPTERYLGRFASGSSLSITVPPFRCVLVGLSADGFDEPVIEGCDQLWIPSPDDVGRAASSWIGAPGSELVVRLHPDGETFTRASVDGIGVDGLLAGGEARIRRSATATASLELSASAQAFEAVDVPKDAGRIASAVLAAREAFDPSANALRMVGAKRVRGGGTRARRCSRRRGTEPTERKDRSRRRHRCASPRAPARPQDRAGHARRGRRRDREGGDGRRRGTRRRRDDPGRRDVRTEGRARTSCPARS